MKRIDITGQVFDRLTVKSYAGNSKGQKALWLCECSCGATVTTTSSRIRSGKTRSCGCLRNELSSERSCIHGHARPGKLSKEFVIWKSMIQRATDPDHKYYENIGVSLSWSKSNGEGFTNFLFDMGYCPEGMSLDRIDVEGNYCKENCRWADKFLQAQNKGKQVNNTTGRTGVYFRKDNGKWRALISSKGLKINLGDFNSFEEACKAREQAELEHFGFIKQ